jgi:hypothetical protein
MYGPAVDVRQAKVETDVTDWLSSPVLSVHNRCESYRLYIIIGSEIHGTM